MEKINSHFPLPISHSISSGFTLIEITIALALTGILVGVGFANLRGYARRQSREAVARQLRGDLRLAQETALAGKKPAGVPCDGPDDYLGGVRFVLPLPSQYQISAVCYAGGIETGPISIKTVSLPTNSSIVLRNSCVSTGLGVGLGSFMFKTLGQGTDLPTTPIPECARVRITTDPGAFHQDIFVTSAGEIR